MLLSCAALKPRFRCALQRRAAAPLKFRVIRHTMQIDSSISGKAANMVHAFVS